jgi:hypothetical protein
VARNRISSHDLQRAYWASNDERCEWLNLGKIDIGTMRLKFFAPEVQCVIEHG